MNVFQSLIGTLKTRWEVQSIYLAAICEFHCKVVHQTEANSHKAQYIQVIDLIGDVVVNRRF